MKNLVHFAVAGVIAAALMALLKVVLTQQGDLVLRWHYPAFELVGASGLDRLLTLLLFGAAYGLLYGLLLKDLLPSGHLVRALCLGCVPTLVDALVLPLRRGQGALRDPWELLWLFAHWTFYALCLTFFVGTKGAGKGGE